MALASRDVVGILADNLRLRGSVLPIPARAATRWTRGLDLRRGGATVLYTGQMPQLVPYIEGLVRMEQRLGDSPLARFTGLGRRVNRVVDVSRLLTHPGARERAEYEQIPRDVARLLRDAGVAFGSLYEDDLYSGALAHDLGLDGLVRGHALKVQAAFRRHGAREAITIDPHTTHMLRTVYPALLDDWDVQVRSYLEVLAAREGAQAAANGTVAIHDSCVFARYEGVVDEPRTLLARAGVTVAEPEHAGAPDLVLRRPGRVALPGEGGGGRRPARRAAAGGGAGGRDDVPALPRQPAEGRRRLDALPRHLPLPRPRRGEGGIPCSMRHSSST